MEVGAWASFSGAAGVRKKKKLAWLRKKEGTGNQLDPYPNVVSCSPEKIRDKLCCKACGCIKSIEIIEPPKDPPPPPPPEKHVKSNAFCVMGDPFAIAGAGMEAVVEELNEIAQSCKY
ncbi:hypothetical protein SLEP1_g26044 [Rubroshorea leprosula]|uniref:Uncharacterized protein n=1 Tax=Rubroshorea leprosula TaxID=152421 RepID=A0AAV5JRB0_9ROSI|nr:hypothetical protein SLEP1_g26044 [Rubroshorea leprosula]